MTAKEPSVFPSLADQLFKSWDYTFSHGVYTTLGPVDE